MLYTRLLLRERVSLRFVCECECVCVCKMYDFAASTFCVQGICSSTTSTLLSSSQLQLSSFLWGSATAGCDLLVFFVAAGAAVARVRGLSWLALFVCDAGTLLRQASRPAQRSAKGHKHSALGCSCSRSCSYTVHWHPTAGPHTYAVHKSSSFGGDGGIVASRLHS